MQKQWRFILAVLITMAGMVMSGCSSDGDTSYSISGTVTLNNSGLAGVSVTLTGTTTAAATTDSSGNYTFSGLQNGSYVVTPLLSGYTFSPTTLSVTVNNANLTGKNFTATAQSVGSVIQLPKTGQTTSYASGDDGDLQRGVAWPDPRFTDNGNGTVTDNLTGLIWLKNANCFGGQAWVTALTSANTLASGACGLTDGSAAGQWRLPNRNELMSLVDRSQYNPVLPSGHPFTFVQSNNYWSGSTYAINTILAWYVYMVGGYVNVISKGSSLYVWPVRAGQ